MKVVLFCGGLGMRLREYSDTIPKPMVEIGTRPLLWHVMKYYSSFGHKDFILCLGYKGDVIKKYFLNYSECLSNNFVLSNGGKDVRLLNTDTQDWRITFVDTGLHSSIGQRLKAVEPYLEGEDIFLANYSDGLTDLHLPGYIDYFHKRNKIACFLAVKPTSSFHVVEIDGGQCVRGIRHLSESDIWMNGGFFIFKKDIFKHIKYGEELITEPFQRLIEKGELISHRYKGFWTCMDTFKDKQLLDDMYSRGDAPWEVWKRHQGEEDLHTRC
jgi:glucose-1-phosphate cytidylyltransferase